MQVNLKAQSCTQSWPDFQLLNQCISSESFSGCCCANRHTSCRQSSQAGISRSCAGPVLAVLQRLSLCLSPCYSCRGSAQVCCAKTDSNIKWETGWARRTVIAGKDHIRFICPLVLCSCCENQLIFLLICKWGLIFELPAAVDRNARKDDDVRWQKLFVRLERNYFSCSYLLAGDNVLSTFLRAWNGSVISYLYTWCGSRAAG